MESAIDSCNVWSRVWSPAESQGGPLALSLSVVVPHLFGCSISLTGTTAGNHPSVLEPSKRSRMFLSGTKRGCPGENPEGSQDRDRRPRFPTVRTLPWYVPERSFADRDYAESPGATAFWTAPLWQCTGG